MKKIARIERVALYLQLALLIFCIQVNVASAETSLEDLGCSAEPQLSSKQGSVSTSVTFINNSSRTIRTYWLNYNGRRVYYAEVEPGKSYVQQTYYTHPWVITNDPSGNCVSLFLPSKEPGVAVVR